MLSPVLPTILCILCFSIFALQSLASPSSPSVTLSQITLAKAKTDPFSISSAPYFKDALKKLMGTNAIIYDQDTQMVEVENSGNYIVVRGGIRGLDLSLSSLVVIDSKTGRLWVGTMNGDGLTIYGARTTADLPKPFSKWSNDIPEHPKMILSGPTTKPPKVDLPEWMQVKPNANLTTVATTGTYARRHGDFHQGAMLLIKEQKGKIQFQLSASCGANTGGAEGNLIKRGDTGIYKSPDFDGKLEFEFSKNTIKVTEVPPGGFGGMGVTMSGTYDRVTDESPKFDPL